MSAVTRSGTNDFRGSVFEFYRDSALNARGFFDTERPSGFARNQFGGSLGGPLLRNRLFFFTSYEGRKSAELLQNAHAALLFYWVELERQVRIEGAVEKTSKKDSETYFQTRPLESKLGAWASRQSSVIPGRGVLEQKMADLRESYRDQEIPAPPPWGGFRVEPAVFEFWQGRANRLHDRIRYTLEGGVWTIERLSP